jgi:hypothetical protein
MNASVAERPLAGDLLASPLRLQLAVSVNSKLDGSSESCPLQAQRGAPLLRLSTTSRR